MILLLAGIAAGSQKVGVYLYKQVITEKEETNENQEKAEDAETSGNLASAMVVVDSGHGGGDPGKVGINGALEKDVNLEIAKKVEKGLQEKGFKVVMTRQDEQGLADSKIEDMKTRVDIINEKKPVLAVSVHQNSYEQESIHGAQVFYFTHSQAGKQAAEVMQEALLAVDPENRRQAKANDTYYMLKRTEVPVIIVECGFLSNREEAERLVTEEYQEKLAEAICDGVVKYCETVK